jgi:hypothetical protein
LYNPVVINPLKTQTFISFSFLVMVHSSFVVRISSGIWQCKSSRGNSRNNMADKFIKHYCNIEWINSTKSFSGLSQTVGHSTPLYRQIFSIPVTTTSCQHNAK